MLLRQSDCTTPAAPPAVCQLAQPPSLTTRLLTTSFAAFATTLRMTVRMDVFSGHVGAEAQWLGCMSNVSINGAGPPPIHRVSIGATSATTSINSDALSLHTVTGLGIRLRSPGSSARGLLSFYPVASSCWCLSLSPGSLGRLSVSRQSHFTHGRTRSGASTWSISTLGRSWLGSGRCLVS